MRVRMLTQVLFAILPDDRSHDNDTQKTVFVIQGGFMWINVILSLFMVAFIFNIYAVPARELTRERQEMVWYVIVCKMAQMTVDIGLTGYPTPTRLTMAVGLAVLRLVQVGR